MVSQPTQSQLDRILAELADLRDSLAILTRRVDRLSTLVEERGIGTETSGVGSASVVSSAAASGYVGQHPTQSVVAEEAGFAVGWAEREAVARGIGLWLRRSVSGEHRGNSGRHRVRESSRLYIVCRDFFGVDHLDPVRICQRFAEVKALCSRNGDWGESVFIGLPSQREVRAALLAGGFNEPATF